MIIWETNIVHVATEVSILIWRATIMMMMVVVMMIVAAVVVTIGAITWGARQRVGVQTISWHKPSSH